MPAYLFESVIFAEIRAAEDEVASVRHPAFLTIDCEHGVVAIEAAHFLTFFAVDAIGPFEGIAHIVFRDFHVFAFFAERLGRGTSAARDVIEFLVGELAFFGVVLLIKRFGLAIAQGDVFFAGGFRDFLDGLGRFDLLDRFFGPFWASFDQLLNA